MRNDIEKHFATSFETEPGQVTEMKFRTKEQNDDYASGIELMGVSSITKTYYDKLTRKWLPYTDRIFQTESI